MAKQKAKTIIMISIAVGNVPGPPTAATGEWNGSRNASANPTPPKIKTPTETTKLSVIFKKITSKSFRMAGYL